MRLAEANPGDVMRDAGGSTWVRTAIGAVCVFVPEDDMSMSPGVVMESSPEVWHLTPPSNDYEDADKLYGPFTRLVPEPTNAD